MIGLAGQWPARSLVALLAALLFAGVGSPGFSSSESRPIAQDRGEAVERQFADAGLELPSGWGDELVRLPIEAVCNTMLGRGLVPYRLGRLLARGDPDSIIAEGWSARRQAPFPLTTPIDWDHLRAVDRSWNFDLHAWRPLQAILERHSRTSQRSDFAFALSVAEDWVERHPYSRRRQHASGEDFSWYDMAVGRRIPQLAYILDVGCRDRSVEIKRLEPLWRSLLAHFDFLSDDRNIVFHSNHGFYQAVGQFFAAGRFAEFEALSTFKRQASRRLLTMIDRHFSAEGVHLEHSPEYHYALTGAISTLARSDSLAEFPALRTRLARMNDALAWMILPNRRLLNVGDSDRVDFTRRRSSERGSDLLDYAMSGGVNGQPTSQRLAVFPASGLAVIRTDWSGGEDSDRASYLAQTAAFHSRVHKQADDLSFVWYDRGADILIDAGRYGYLGRTKPGSDLWEQGFWYADPKRIYVESTRAHNTVEIDGRSFDRKRSKPYGSAIERWGETEDGLFFVETHARQFRTMRHARVLVMNPQEWLLVFDWLWDNRKEPHAYRQWFHFAPRLTVEREGRGLTVSGADLDTELKVVSLLPSPAVSAPVRGRETPTLLGWWSEQGGAFDPVTSVNFHVGDSPSAVFATLFAFADEDVCPDYDRQRVNLSGRKARLGWSGEGVTHTLSLDRPAEGAMRVDYSAEPRSVGALAADAGCGR